MRAYRKGRNFLSGDLTAHVSMQAVGGAALSFDFVHVHICNGLILVHNAP